MGKKNGPPLFSIRIPHRSATAAVYSFLTKADALPWPRGCVNLLPVQTKTIPVSSELLARIKNEEQDGVSI